MSGSLVDLFAERRPGADVVAVREALAGARPGEVLSYGDLDVRSGAVAAALVTGGVRPGDRVAVQVPTSPDAVAVHLACLRAGAVHLPLNPGATDEELAYVLADAEPAALVREPARTAEVPDHVRLVVTLAELAASDAGDTADVPRAGDDPAALVYTSGTTGRPKGALLTHANLVHNARVLVDAWGFTRSDTVLHVLPMHHTHGLFVALHCALASGSSVLLLAKFDPADAVALMPSATVLMGVPTHYVRLLAEPGFDAVATAGLRLMTSGSAPLPARTHAEVLRRTGHVVLERYGMTETSILTSNPLLGERRPGSVGPALPGVGVRVVDNDDRPVPADVVGAVQVSGPGVFGGYWHRPELRATEFTADGWFRTGDLGSLSSDGYLTIAGRSKELIISGGLNVYPKEVEAVLDELPEVRESAVVGLPDVDLGEVVVAVLVLAAAHAASDDEAPPASVDVDWVRARCRQRLAGYKLPRRVVVVTELPRNALGKVEKARLRQTLVATDAVVTEAPPAP